MENQTTEDALRDCRRRLSSLLSTVPGMAYRCRIDRDWTMEAISAGCESLTGYPPRDLIRNARLAFASLIHPEDRRMVHVAVQEAVRGNRTFQAAYRIRTAQGQEKWVLEKGQVVVGKENGDLSLEGFISDITEHKLAEALLKDEISQRRMLVEQSRDGIVILHRNGTVFEANRQFAAMLGYTMEEVGELHVWDWDKNLSSEILAEMIQSVDADGDHFETRHKRKDGTFYDVEISTNGVVYRGLKLILCICRDITARKQAEEEREKLITELQAALAEIKTLKGILPICSYCKKIRDDKGSWEQVDVYIHRHSQADISHSICPECAEQHYPDIDFDD